MRLWPSGVFVLCLLLFTVDAGAESADGPFASVDGESISRAEYETAVAIAARQRFYHGRFDDKRLALLREQVAADLIDRLLLKHEAQRRGIKVNAADVERQVAKESRRYQLDALSKDQRRHMLGMMRRQVEEVQVRQALEGQVKSLPEPSDAEVRAYYEAHLDKFTTPPQLHLSLILLRVAPSAPVESWRAALAEAQRLRQKLLAGADFAELATLHSGDGSSERGGDLGFVHEGMLSHEAQQAVDALKEGGVTEPVNLLQGVALFKLLGRQPAVVNPFARVSDRARGLLQRESSAQAWEGLLRTLRSKAQIRFFNNEITTKMIWADGAATKQ